MAARYATRLKGSTAGERRVARRAPMGEVAPFWGQRSWGGKWPTLLYNPSLLVGRQGLGIFERMARDDQIKAALNYKVNAVLAPGYEIVSPDGKPDDWEVTQFVRRRLLAMECSVERLLATMLKAAMTYGFCVSEMVWEEVAAATEAGGEDPDRGLVGVRNVKVKRPLDVGFEIDDYGNILPLGIVSTWDRQKFPRRKFVHMTFGENFHNPYGESDLEGAYRSWVVLDNAYKWLAMYLERLGIPPIFALYNAAAYDEQDIEELKGVLQNLQNATTGTIPRGSAEDLEMWTPELAGQVAEVFVPAMEFLKKDMARSMLMPGFLGVTPDEEGSYARAKVTFDMFLLHVKYVQSCLREGVMQEQIIKRLVDMNFVVDAYPQFRFMPLTDDARADLAKAWADLVGDNIVSPAPDDEDHVRAMLGFPRRHVRSSKDGVPQVPLVHLANLAPAFTINEIRESMGFAKVAWGDQQLRTDIMGSFARDSGGKFGPGTDADRVPASPAGTPGGAKAAPEERAA